MFVSHKKLQYIVSLVKAVGEVQRYDGDWWCGHSEPIIINTSAMEPMLYLCTYSPYKKVSYFLYVILEIQ